MWTSPRTDRNVPLQFSPYHPSCSPGHCRLARCRVDLHGCDLAAFGIAQPVVFRLWSMVWEDEGYFSGTVSAHGANASNPLLQVVCGVENCKRVLLATHRKQRRRLWPFPKGQFRVDANVHARNPLGARRPSPSPTTTTTSSSSSSSSTPTSS